MLLKRRKPSSFGADGRRVGGGSSSQSALALPSTSSSGTGTSSTTNNIPAASIRRPVGTGLVRRRTSTPGSSSSSLLTGGKENSTNAGPTGSSSSFSAPSNGFRKPVIGRPGTGIIRRAPVMAGLSVSGIGSSGLLKPFQRPKTGRRAYKGGENEALKRSSLGPKRISGGMERLMARAGKGLNFKTVGRPKLGGGDGDSSSDEDDDEEEEDRPFEPLCVWVSPHQDGGEAKGIPGTIVREIQPDEYGVEEEVTVVKPAPLSMYSNKNVFVPPILAKWLRPHQREGVAFMYQCVMGLKEYNGNGCILADDMGLGKTLQSVTLIYTLLKTGVTKDNRPTAKRVIVVCPCSLVKNWENEFVKWLGPGGVKTLAIAEADRKKVEKDLDSFAKTSIFQILICSYECLRTHVGRLIKYPNCCDLLVCDEAHRLKNSENQTSRALNSIPVKRRVLLTGTPMQNDLQEFYAMVDFTNPGILGTQDEFRKHTLFPILRGREPDATERQKERMQEIQNEMSSIVNEFILRRTNTLNAQHLPPKLVQVVCCNLTEIQRNMYQHLVQSKAMQHLTDGKQVNCLGSIQMLMKLCNHPSLIANDDTSRTADTGGRRRAASKKISYAEDETNFQAPGAEGVSKYLPQVAAGGGRGSTAPVFPQWSGKMFVLYRLMKEMRRPGNGNDKIVIISNYTQTLDLIGRMCRENSWGFCRLDGSIGMKKRQKMVDDFNDPSTNLIAFLLSSKAGGCGLNLIGGNRLVLFDPDWNPAVDKQAAARCWRDGQTKRCFTYRFLATGTVEEKIFQRQLSKEGLQSVVDDKEQVNALSTKDLRNLFKLRTGTPSDTHDKLKCERCAITQDNHELEEKKVLPKKLRACQELLSEMVELDDAKMFLAPLQPHEYGVSKEDYEKVVKQPMDLSTIQKRLSLDQNQAQAYKSVSGVSKDVNRIFSNVVKVWTGGDEIFEASRRLQLWWTEKWPELVATLMIMKPDDDPSSESICKPCGADDQTNNEATFGSQINERSDDYNEQLGMPEEEDMRSWSHHHRTDTVDDPVFRAAMRGCDAVSFVFGLEVTWSLIQQRQQEEEEEKAMQELKCIEELGGIGDDEDGDEDDGSDNNDEDSKVGVAQVSDEAEKESSSDGSKSMHRSDSEEESSDEVGESEDSAYNSKPSSNISKTKTSVPSNESDDEDRSDDIEGAYCNRSIDNDAGEDDESIESMDRGNDSDDDKSNKSRNLDDASEADESSEGMYLGDSPLHSSNSDSNEDECSPSPRKRSTSTRSEESKDIDGNNSNKWSCLACTFENNLQAKKCKICNTMKGSSTAPTPSKRSRK